MLTAEQERRLATLRDERERFLAAPQMERITAFFETPQSAERAEILPFLKDTLQDCQWLIDLSVYWTAQMANTPGFASPMLGQPSESGTDVVRSAQVFLHERGSLSLQSLDSSVIRPASGEGDIELSGRDVLLKVIGPGRLVCEITEVEPVDELIDLDFPVSIVGRREVILDADSDVFHVDGRVMGMRFLNVERNPILYIGHAFAGQLPFCLRLDGATGRCKKVEANNLPDSRIRMGLACLRLLPVDRLPILEQLSNHSVFFLRWQALREMAALMGTESLGRLRRALEQERHPYLKRSIAHLVAHIEGIQSSTPQR